MSKLQGRGAVRRRWSDGWLRSMQRNRRGQAAAIPWIEAMSAKLRRADQLKQRDRFLLICGNGRTIATVQGIEELTERDLLSPDQAHRARPNPILGLQIATARPVAVPDVPGWKMQIFTIYAAPGDLFEPYI